MAYSDEKALKGHIASKKYNNIYVLFGNEKYLVKHYTNLLIKKVAGETPDEFAFHEFTKEVDLQNLSVAVGAVAFTAPCNCVVVYDYDMNKLDKTDFEALQSIALDVPDTTVLIFSYPTLDTNAKTGEAGKKSKFKPFCDSIVKAKGEVFELSERDAVALEHQLAKWADKAGKKLSLPVASKIIFYCGTNLQTLRNELDKLIAFTGEREEIDINDVEKIVIKKLEARIFDLMDFVILGNLDKAYSLLYKLFELKEDPRTIVRLLGTAYVDIYRARVTNESGGNMKETADFFKYGNRTWVLNKSKSKAEKLSTNAIRRSMTEIIDLSARLNTITLNEEAEVEKLIARLTLIAKEELVYA
ncbi:MAG: DNA polymerase III subunit delta [Clostridia bacterium]|nr:DNA polymerase III subunit delta [Clostridia bacterium]